MIVLKILSLLKAIINSYTILKYKKYNKKRLWNKKKQNNFKFISILKLRKYAFKPRKILS